MSLDHDRRDSGSFERTSDSGRIYFVEGDYVGPERRRISGEFALKPPSDAPQPSRWLLACIGSLLVLAGGLAGAVVTHEREQQNQTDRIANFELRLSSDEDRLKTGLVSREEFMQFSARVLDGQGEIRAELLRLRQELERRH